MKEQHLIIAITVNATSEDAFKSINNVTKWWTENLEGSSEKTGDEFTVDLAMFMYQHKNWLRLFRVKK